MLNVKTLERHLGSGIEHMPDLPVDAGGSAAQVQIAFARSGHPVLKVVGDNGRRTTLHSLVNPADEARRLYAQTRPPENALIVILGAGMGYHIDALMGLLRGRTIIIVEKEKNILRHMLAYAPVTDWHRVAQIYFVTGDDCADCIRSISRIQARHGFLPLALIEHAPSLHAFPEFYGTVKNRLQAISSVNILKKLRYRKFKQQSLNVLILQSKYYLVAEMLNSLKKLGHKIKIVMIDGSRNSSGTQDIIERIIAEVLLFKPDFILTVNHLGFDREGILTQFFTDIELPHASWYVDSPTFILDDFKKQRSPYLSIFLWDSDYLAEMTERGFENVFTLPLAADTDIFKKIPLMKQSKLFACDVGFVGSSGTMIIEECLKEMNAGRAELALLDKLAGGFADAPTRRICDLNIALDSEERLLLSRLMNECRKSFEPAVTWRATQLYRVACVKKLLKFKPHIYGDCGWKQYVNGAAVLRPELNYYDDLPGLYNACTVNFNTTSLQMKTGVNQRVFDVPACGAFLITDYRRQLENFFEPGREVICYSTAEDIEDLIRYYLKHEHERVQITERAHDRVLREHTYVRRLTQLVDRMRRLYE